MVVMVGRAVMLVAVAGCYAPKATQGAPCDERMLCPTGQVCYAGRCEPEGTMHDIDAPPPLDDAPAADARAIDAPMNLGPWGAPTPVGIELGSSKSDPSFTPDRLMVVYARSEDLFIATRPAIGGTWTITPYPFNTMNVEKCPEITADGKTLYFTSNPDGDYDVFVSTFTTAWSMPAKVPGWDSPSNEQDVAISPDELTAFIGISSDLRRATRATKAAAWPAPATISGIAWGQGATAPSITSAGDVYFHAGATRDLFVARRDGNSYAAPVPVTELNTAGRDAAPFVSADDRHIMFERDAELLESTR